VYGSHQHVPPHPPEAKPPPSYHLGSGRRPEKSHCTELSNTLYTQRYNRLLEYILNKCFVYIIKVQMPKIKKKCNATDDYIRRKQATDLK
jgi:hypothetical protein